MAVAFAPWSSWPATFDWLARRAGRASFPCCVRSMILQKSLSRVLNAIFYMIKSGCHWRLLPKDFPLCKTVFHIFRQWTLNHTWDAINARLRAASSVEAMKIAAYDSDLTNAQWAFLQPILPSATRWGGLHLSPPLPQRHSLRRQRRHRMALVAQGFSSVQNRLP